MDKVIIGQLTNEKFKDYAQKNLGYFTDINDTVKSREKAEIEYYRDFSYNYSQEKYFKEIQQVI